MTVKHGHKDGFVLNASNRTLMMVLLIKSSSFTLSSMFEAENANVELAVFILLSAFVKQRVSFHRKLNKALVILPRRKRRHPPPQPPIHRRAHRKNRTNSIHHSPIPNERRAKSECRAGTDLSWQISSSSFQKVLYE